MKYLKKKWVQACEGPSYMKDINISTARACSKHFEPSNYIEKLPIKKLLGWSPKHYRVLKCDAVPSICLPSQSGVKKTLFKAISPRKITPKNRPKNTLKVIPKHKLKMTPSKS
ncbi:unnamed protein product [Macrosiphum euphorbiae]|uniref:THAP-type domain-containing protein n=1 Tax=Macrosiphum euphorbiae TaxID=13131 RepID=A0AAV0W9A3_9HEMI|nr:unnamed protein product [Macrosiphum euphorbiae]